MQTKACADFGVLINVDVVPFKSEIPYQLRILQKHAFCDVAVWALMPPKENRGDRILIFGERLVESVGSQLRRRDFGENGVKRPGVVHPPIMAEVTDFCKKWPSELREPDGSKTRSDGVVRDRS